MLSFILVSQMRKGCWLCFFFILLSSFTGSVLSHSNSEYINSLSGEAKILTLDSVTRSEVQIFNQESRLDTAEIISDKSNAGAIQELVPGLTLQQFEKILKNNYMGSYLFYRHLDDNRKKEAYIFYLDNPDSNSLREKIIQLKKQ